MKPALAATFDPKKDKLPVYLASPKIDGIRARVVGGVVLSRSGAPLPSRAVQSAFGALEGLEGEIVQGGTTGEGVFKRAHAACMSPTASGAGLQFLAFDCLRFPDEPFSARLARIPSSLRVEHSAIPATGVAEFEGRMVASGFEGAMLRDPQAPYQPGRHRGTLKVKSFETAEAHVVGHGDRNLDLVTSEGVRFSVASGLTEEDREDLARFVGQVVSYSFFPTAGHTAPRFPVFRGVRSPLDM